MCLQLLTTLVPENFLKPDTSSSIFSTPTRQRTNPHTWECLKNQIPHSLSTENSQMLGVTARGWGDVEVSISSARKAGIWAFVLGNHLWTEIQSVWNEEWNCYINECGGSHLQSQLEMTCQVLSGSEDVYRGCQNISFPGNHISWKQTFCFSQISSTISSGAREGHGSEVGIRPAFFMSASINL